MLASWRHHGPGGGGIFPFSSIAAGTPCVALARVWARPSCSPGSLTHPHRQPRGSAAAVMFMANHLSVRHLRCSSRFLPVRMISRNSSAASRSLAGHARRPIIFIDRQNPTPPAAASKRRRGGSSGHAEMLFPEGTALADGCLGPFKKGGFHLAIASGADIVPASARHAEVMRRGSLLISRRHHRRHRRPHLDRGLDRRRSRRPARGVRKQIRQMSGQAIGRPGHHPSTSPAGAVRAPAARSPVRMRSMASAASYAEVDQCADQMRTMFCGWRRPDVDGRSAPRRSMSRRRITRTGGAPSQSTRGRPEVARRTAAGGSPHAARSSTERQCQLARVQRERTR